MKTLKTAVMVMMVGSAAALAVPGQGRGGERGRDTGDREPGRGRMMASLDLTSEQKDQLRALHEEQAETMVDLRAAAEKAHLKTVSLLSQETVDRDAVMKAVKKEGAAAEALRLAHVEHQLKVREVVGAEKAARLMDMREAGRGKGPGAHSCRKAGDGPDAGPSGD